MSRNTQSYAGMLLVLGLSLSTGAVCFAQRLRSEPVNPAWAAYRDALRRHAAPAVTLDGHRLGHVPSPFLHGGSERARALRGPSFSGPPPPPASVTSYDLRNTSGKVPAIRDQGSSGSCWAFACMASLETCLRPADTFDGSENNLKNTHGFDLDPNTGGGNASMSTAYFSRWSGPVAEADDPYNPLSTSSPAGLPVRKHLQDAIFLPDRTSKTDNDLIKTMIMTYGALDCAFYYSSGSYNSTTHAYYYTGTGTNHEVSAIGWDDNYPAANFNAAPPGNGAFLLRNQWGTSWGDGGYFWLSYYDTSLQEFTCFEDAEATTNYATEYSYDPLGWVTSLSIGTNSIYYANVFPKGAQAEQLRAVATYATAAGTDYQISIYRNPSGGPVSSPLARLQRALLPLAGIRDRTASGPGTGAPALTQSGTFGYKGFHTVVLTTPVSLGATDTSFSVVVKAMNAGNTYLMPVEYAYAGYTSAAAAAPGQGYWSTDGTSWGDITSDWNSTCNFCVKAYTNPTTTYQPDAAIRNPDPDTYLGDGTISSDGTNETKSQKANPAALATYLVKVKNAGVAADNITITGPAAGSGWTVQYFDAVSGGSDKTPSVTGNGWTVPSVAVNGTFEFRVQVTPSASVQAGAVQNVLVTAKSGTEPTKLDAVLAVTTRATLRPDMLIRNPSDTNYLGGGAYSNSGTGQTKTQSAPAGVAAVFPLKVQNNGDPDEFKVTGPAGSTGWTVKYFDALSGGNDITSDVTGGGKRTGTLANLATREWRVEVKPEATLASGASLNVLVTATSMADTSMADTVKAVTNLALYKPDMLVKNSTDTTYLGGGVINTIGKDQTKAQRVQAGVAAIYHLKVQNAGDTDDTFTVTGTTGGNGWTVQYFDALTGGTERTGEIGGAGWSTGVIAHGATKEFRVQVKPGTGVALGDQKDVLVKAASVGNPAASDTVKASTTLIGATAPPALAWAGAAGYQSDGVEPGSGAANSLFTFQVKLTDRDGDEPGWVHLVLTRNGAPYLTSTMKPATSPAPPTITGRVYSVKKRLPAGNYTYQFAAQDDDGAATGNPTQAKVGPVMQTGPFLTWAGTAGFKTGGVSPGTGRADKTMFQFQVKYQAYDGNRPTSIQVVLKRGKTTVGPFPLALLRGSSPVTGLVYGVARKLPAGPYGYRFQAADKHGSAGGPASKTMPGPIVTAAGASVLSALSAAPTRAGGTQVVFSLAATAQVEARVLNLAGRPVKTLCRDRACDAGANTLLWNAQSDAGLAVPSGTYLIEIAARWADGTAARALTMVRIDR